MLKKLGLIFLLSLTTSLYAEEVKTSIDKTSVQETIEVKETPKEEAAESAHSVTINGVDVKYKAIAGNILLRNDKYNPHASLFYIAYFKEDVKDKTERPLIFCFNGGPGSSAVWLHMGLLGPKRILIDENGQNLPPYQLVNNEYSLLDIADLVFIDPVSTGYSRTINGTDVKQFHEVDGDIESIGHFIRQFLTNYERWDSPKFLAGESYGTTRAAGLAEHLHSKQHIYLNGILLISSVLNFQTLYDHVGGNDLPYPLFLPTYTATAWYHKKLPAELQKDLYKTLEEAKQFALTDYTLALMKGNMLTKEENDKIVKKLAYFTGVSPEFIERSQLRISPYLYATELLRSKKQVVGRFDSREVGDTLDTSCDVSFYDPSFDDVIGAYTAAFNHYIRNDLHVGSEREYKILANIHSSWDYSKATNQFLNMSSKLHDVMIKNKQLKIFVASGYYDMAAPFFATDYTFSHLGLPDHLQKHISMHYYDAGHMMYLQKNPLEKMKKDFVQWFKDLKNN